MASYRSGDSLWSRLEYRKLATRVLGDPSKKAVRMFERGLGKEIKKARKRRSKLSFQEKKWIKAKLDPQEQFRMKYLR